MAHSSKIKPKFSHVAGVVFIFFSDSAQSFWEFRTKNSHLRYSSKEFNTNTFIRAREYGCHQNPLRVRRPKAFFISQSKCLARAVPQR